MRAGAGFTDAVRQELARLPIASAGEVRAELSALLRHAGSLQVTGGGSPRRSLEVTTGSGAVARRTYTLVQHRYGLRPQLLVRAPGGVRPRSVYGVRIEVGADRVGVDLGLIDAAGRPLDGLPADLDRPAALAYVRGALLAAGSISDPGRAPHLEVTTHTARAAQALAALIRGTVQVEVRAVEEAGRDRTRVVCKSGAAIGDLLAATGASVARLRWDERRLRRQLRSEANRLANADAANLRRTIDAAGAQVRVVEEVVAALGWDELDDDLRGIALARLANPTATLQELGQLVDPPVGKSAVHRRLRRLEEVHAEVVGGERGPA